MAAILQSGEERRADGGRRDDRRSGHDLHRAGRRPSAPTRSSIPASISRGARASAPRCEIHSGVRIVDCDDRRRGRDQQLLRHHRVARVERRAHRPVRAHPAAVRRRRGRARRQLRRAEEDRRSARARRRTTCRTSATRRSARRSTSAPARSPATTTASHKHPTVIEDGAFIGSDSQLVAPVRVGEGAYVAAGSSITEDVPADALAIARGKQVNKDGWVRRTRRNSQRSVTVPRITNMCGIIGYIGSKKVVPILIDGLRRLEYRGYDSAGVAVVRNGAIELRRSAGKLARLEEVIATTPLDGDYGIGHTRWATHGRPTEENAHPHRDCTGRIVVVHNGIIENYLDLKQQLQKEGHTFVTETDTEIVAHLVEREMKDDGLENAVRRALLYMRGLFALVLISADDPNKIVTVRNGPPIVVGLGDGRVLRRLRHPGDPQPHARRRVPGRRGDGGHHAVRASSSPTTRAARSRRRARGWRGIRSWPRRPATSTSCSRRSSSSRGRSRKRCSAARRWRAARCSCTRSRSPTRCCATSSGS